METLPRNWRLFLALFLVKIWRLKAWLRLIVPPGRTAKRFDALFFCFHLGHIKLLLYEHLGVRKSFHPYRTLVRLFHFFFLGANTIVICRLVFLGVCSTCPYSSSSWRKRSRTRMPMSWRAISRPLKRNVICVLLPSSKKRFRLFNLTLKSPSSVPGRNLTSLTRIIFCLSFASRAFLAS